MAHHTLKSGYAQLSERLNRFPQGAPPSELLFSILEILFSEKEAELVSNLPIRPFSAEKAGRAWRMSPAEAQKNLDALASRAILVDIEQDGETVYVLPPPMAGFFEFSMMRVRDDIDQQALSELFYEYMNVEEDFIRELFTEGETQLGRTFVNEPALSNENALHVLDYERATQVIETATHRGIGMCYCRHKMEHKGQDCDAPKDICMTFNNTAASLIRHEYAREVDVREGWTCCRRPTSITWSSSVKMCGTGKLHLQLLRMLLRGDDRGTAVCHSESRPYNKFPSRDRRKDLQWMWQMRQRLPGRSNDAGLRERRKQTEFENGKVE